MTLLDFLRLTRANIILLVLGIVLGALAGFGYAAMQPKVYTSTSSGYVAYGTDAKDGATPDLFSGDQAAQTKAKSYVPLLTSAPVAQKIKEKTGTSLSTSQIQSSLSAGVDSGSTLIRVQADAGTPEDSAKLANEALNAGASVIKDIEGPRSEVKVIPLDDAQTPSGPSSPNYKALIGVGAAAGLLLAYLIAFLRRYADVKVRTTKDLETATGAGVLGMLPKSDSLNDNAFLRDEADHRSEEALRQLRTNLRFVSVDNPPRSIIVTSPNPGEGKSTVTANLAHAFTRSGQPTVLVDADLRRPTLAKIFGLDNTVGLSQILSGQVELEDAVQQIGDSELYVIPAGKIPPNPSELLGSEKMHQLIADLGREYFVLVDVPPLLPVTDGALLSTGVDGTILVTSVGSTRKDQAEAAAGMIRKVQGRILGTVLNKTPSKGVGSQYYGFGYTGYRTGYQAYYGSDTKKGRKKKARKAKAKK